MVLAFRGCCLGNAISFRLHTVNQEPQGTLFPSSPVYRPYDTKIKSNAAIVTLNPRLYTERLPCPWSLKRKNKLLNKLINIKMITIAISDFSIRGL